MYNQVNRLVNEAMSCLGPLISEEVTGREIQNCRTELENIITSAGKLDLQMSLQFASYIIQMDSMRVDGDSSRRVVFDSATMVADSMTSDKLKSSKTGPAISLMVTPPLLKFGDQDGCGFLGARRVIEMGVVINPAAKKPRWYKQVSSLY
jgi:hypothetical protein